MFIKPTIVAFKFAIKQVQVITIISCFYDYPAFFSFLITFDLLLLLSRSWVYFHCTGRWSVCLGWLGGGPIGSCCAIGVGGCVCGCSYAGSLLVGGSLPSTLLVLRMNLYNLLCPGFLLSLGPNSRRVAHLWWLLQPGWLMNWSQWSFLAVGSCDGGLKLWKIRFPSHFSRKVLDDLAFPRNYKGRNVHSHKVGTSPHCRLGFVADDDCISRFFALTLL